MRTLWKSGTKAKFYLPDNTRIYSHRSSSFSFYPFVNYPFFSLSRKHKISLNEKSKLALYLSLLHYHKLLVKYKKYKPILFSLQNKPVSGFIKLQIHQQGCTYPLVWIHVQQQKGNLCQSAFSTDQSFQLNDLKE